MSPDHRAPASGRSTVPAMVAVTVAVAVTLAGFVLLALLTDRPYAYFSKEPAEVFGEPRYVGWAAVITTLAAAGGAASASFAGLLVRLQRGRCDEAGFLLGMGVFIWILVLDDVLQLHDWIVPRFLPGVDERTLFTSYTLVLAVVLWRWGRRVVFGTEVSIALLAAAGLALSLAFGLFVPNDIAFYHLIEDGAKLFGLAMLTLYLVRSGLRFALDAPAAPGASGVPAAPARSDAVAVSDAGVAGGRAADDVEPVLVPLRGGAVAGLAPGADGAPVIPRPRPAADRLGTPGL